VERFIALHFSISFSIFLAEIFMMSKF